MKTFLEYVAEDIVKKMGSNLSRIAIVFPNKRASLFMNDYLYETTHATMWGPTYLTISELFRSRSKLQLADEIRLISELFSVYKEISGTKETLDHFYPWGKILISDFDDIDKNMADAKQVFTNVKNLNEMSSDSYLNDEQRKALASLFGNYQDSHLRKEFVELWNILHEIYVIFKRKLTEENVAYEGMLYRDVIEKETCFDEFEKYIFVGFNFLDKVEQVLFMKLKKSGRAMFYWDFDVAYMDNSFNLPSDPGSSIKEHLIDFPNEIDLDSTAYNNLNSSKEISILSSTTENIQARYVSQWLKENDCCRIKAGRKTAIVLADEKMLKSINHSLPNNIDDSAIPPYDVNITTGFPLADTPVASLVDILLQMRIERKQNGEVRKATVTKLLKHPMSHYLSSSVVLLSDRLQQIYTPYVKKDNLAIDENLSVVFDGGQRGTDENEIVLITTWLGGVVNLIAKNASETDDPLFRESIYRFHLILNRISDLAKEGYFEVEKNTFQKLVRQIVSSATIPFHGEPAQGIQIMGVLETRNLDFDNLLILSCNEGKWPNGLNVTSFIPYNIRKAFSLTTIDNKIGIQAFHFFRLLQRAEDITIVYNNATDDGQKGELSRYVLQLMIQNKNDISKKTLIAKQSTINKRPISIAKDDKVIDKLISIERLSPTAINNYLNCNLKFYFNIVLGLKEPDDNQEKVGGRTFGNIYHRVSQLIYLSMTSSDNIFEDERGRAIVKSPFTVSKEQIKYFLDNPKSIERYVDIAFNEELFHKNNCDTTPSLNGLQIISCRVIIDYVNAMLRNDIENTPFKIAGLENEINFAIKTDNGLEISIKGIIDRLDIISIDGTNKMRVVDYKTGRPHSDKFKSIDDIFISGKDRKQLADYYLQTMIYASVVRNSMEYNPGGLQTLPSLMFIQSLNDEDCSPILKISDSEITDIKLYEDEFSTLVNKTLSEIYDSSIDFHPTGSPSKCATCPYKQICHST